MLTQQAIPAIVVTHDWAEALTLGDIIAVMNAGQVLQVGSPQEVFSRPANAEVAKIVGIETVIQGHVVANDSGLATVSVNGTRLKDLVADVNGAAVSAFAQKMCCLSRRGAASRVRAITCPAM